MIGAGDCNPKGVQSVSQAAVMLLTQDSRLAYALTIKAANCGTEATAMRRKAIKRSTKSKLVKAVGRMPAYGSLTNCFLSMELALVWSFPRGGEPHHRGAMVDSAGLLPDIDLTNAIRTAST